MLTKAASYAPRENKKVKLHQAARFHPTSPPYPPHSTRLPQSLALRPYGGDEFALARGNLGHTEIPPSRLRLRSRAAALGHATKYLQLGFQRRRPLAPAVHRHHHPIHLQLLLLLEGEDDRKFEPSPARFCIGVDLPLPAHGSETFRVAPRHTRGFSDGGAANDLAVGAEDDAAADVFAVAGRSVELGATPMGWETEWMDRAKEELRLLLAVLLTILY